MVRRDFQVMLGSVVMYRRQETIHHDFPWASDVLRSPLHFPSGDESEVWAITHLCFAFESCACVYCSVLYILCLLCLPIGFRALPTVSATNSSFCAHICDQEPICKCHITHSTATACFRAPYVSSTKNGYFWLFSSINACFWLILWVFNHFRALASVFEHYRLQLPATAHPQLKNSIFEP